MKAYHKVLLKASPRVHGGDRSYRVDYLDWNRLLLCALNTRPVLGFHLLHALAVRGPFLAVGPEGFAHLPLLLIENYSFCQESAEVRGGQMYHTSIKSTIDRFSVFSPGGTNLVCPFKST